MMITFPKKQPPFAKPFDPNLRPPTSAAIVLPPAPMLSFEGFTLLSGADEIGSYAYPKHADPTRHFYTRAKPGRFPCWRDGIYYSYIEVIDFWRASMLLKNVGWEFRELHNANLVAGLKALLAQAAERRCVTSSRDRHKKPGIANDN